MRTPSEGSDEREAALATLRQHDTPTVCNALDIVFGRRYSEGFTRQTLHCADPTLAPLVGYARTATIRTCTPAEGTEDQQLESRLRYYRHMSTGAEPGICVIQI